MTRWTHVVLMAALVTSTPVTAQSDKPIVARTTVIEPEGELGKIDTSATIKVMRRLQSADPATKKGAIDEVRFNAGRFAPPALCAMSNELFNLGEKDEAVFWFYLGQLRARSDANKCNDVTARQAVQVLTQTYGPPINKHAFSRIDVDYKKNVAALKQLTERIVSWDRQAAREYDPRWISLHGMGVVLNDAEPFEPKERWAAIDEQTRIAYLSGLDEAVQMYSEMDTNQDGAVSKSEQESFFEKQIADSTKQLRHGRTSRPTSSERVESERYK